MEAGNKKSFADRVGEGISRSMAGYAGVMLLLFVGSLCWSGYEALDNAGWIIHHRDTPVYIDGNWMNAEYRNCSLYFTIHILECGDLHAPDTRGQVLPVKYHGRVDRKDQAHFTWRCQRSDKGLECWALD